MCVCVGGGGVLGEGGKADGYFLNTLYLRTKKECQAITPATDRS